VTVVITDIQVGLGEAAATESGCTFLPQDVTAEADRLQVMNMIRSRFGGLHVWVNNAGVAGLLATLAPPPTARRRQLSHS
jgi:NAD(P)-dependent dehydrogenase (short-subunit alcohol dehydrogenase family)